MPGRRCCASSTRIQPGHLSYRTLRSTKYVVLRRQNLITRILMLA